MEIERKFLVNTTLWNALSKPVPTKIVQGYLSIDQNCTVRVRIKGDKGFVTIKGKTTGISRSEYEYGIPLDEAESMILEFCSKSISKDRYCFKNGIHIWEVDVFHGKLAPLIIAEIELSSETEKFSIPEWISTEVSDDPGYYNSRLIERL